MASTNPTHDEMSEIEYSEILDRSNEVEPENPADNLIDFQLMEQLQGDF